MTKARHQHGPDMCKPFETPRGYDTHQDRSVPVKVAAGIAMTYLKARS